MTREEREKYVRTLIFNTTTLEQAVQAIVDRWENDVDDNRVDVVNTITSEMSETY